MLRFVRRSPALMGLRVFWISLTSDSRPKFDLERASSLLRRSLTFISKYSASYSATRARFRVNGLMGSIYRLASESSLRFLAGHDSSRRCRTLSKIITFILTRLKEHAGHARWQRTTVKFSPVDATEDDGGSPRQRGEPLGH